MTLEELQALTASNARSIQAMGEAMREAMETSRLQAEVERREMRAAMEASRLQAEEDRRRADVERQELREAMQRLTEAMMGIANLTVSLDSDRPTVLNKLNRIETGVELLKKHLGAE